jgi:hypothetical protein
VGRLGRPDRLLTLKWVARGRLFAAHPSLTTLVVDCDNIAEPRRLVLHSKPTPLIAHYHCRTSSYYKKVMLHLTQSTRPQAAKRLNSTQPRRELLE